VCDPEVILEARNVKTEINYDASFLTMLRISKFFQRSKQKPYVIFLFNKAIKTFETHFRMFRKIKKY